MSNGGPNDHPGEYHFIPKPVGADAMKTLAEVQEVQGFLLVAMDADVMAFYKKVGKR
jgi:hypothetical protein